MPRLTKILDLKIVELLPEKITVFLDSQIKIEDRHMAMFATLVYRC